jgi:hypothetical protein
MQVSKWDHDKYIVIHYLIMSEKYHHSKTMYLVAVSAAILLGSFVVGSQFLQQTLAQDMGQDVERNETGNQTANQSAGLGDPSKLYVPRQPVK